MRDGSAPAVRPVLKWAGGKRQLLPHLRRFYPVAFRGYLEPFIGSGAVFFDLYNRGQLADRPVWLADANPDLIGCYRAIRDSVEEVIGHLEALAAGHRANGSTHYYDVRDRLFNPLRAELVRMGGPTVTYPAKLAAMLLYLNRTGYNGLFRLNASGGFNVPAGRYENPRISDPDNLRRAATAFAQRNVRLEYRPFADVAAEALEDDFVYLDPPYAPISATARFTSYTAGGFSQADQERLQRTVFGLVSIGCHVLLSNSTAPEISALYATPAARAAGLAAHEVPVRRAINSRATGRRGVTEYLITNVGARASVPIDA